MTNDKIAFFWKRNVPAKNYNKSFHTDGYDLYSYQQLIGITRNGLKILFNYTSSSNSFISNTTSTHVNYAKNYSDEIIHPEERFL